MKYLYTILLFFTSYLLFAQGPPGTIEVLVIDTKGNYIDGAVISVTDGTGSKGRGISDKYGVCVIDSIDPGIYAVTIDDDRYSTTRVVEVIMQPNGHTYLKISRIKPRRKRTKIDFRVYKRPDRLTHVKGTTIIRHNYTDRLLPKRYNYELHPVFIDKPRIVYYIPR